VQNDKWCVKGLELDGLNDITDGNDIDGEIISLTHMAGTCVFCLSGTACRMRTE